MHTHPPTHPPTTTFRTAAASVPPLFNQAKCCTNLRKTYNSFVCNLWGTWLTVTAVTQSALSERKNEPSKQHTGCHATPPFCPSCSKQSKGGSQLSVRQHKNTHTHTLTLYTDPPSTPEASVAWQVKDTEGSRAVRATNCSCAAASASTASASRCEDWKVEGNIKQCVYM